MRMMSFSLTTDAVVRREKIVTRRSVSTWTHLKPGDRLRAVDKVMGLRKGQKPRELAIIEVVSVRVEPLDAITDADAVDECFGGGGMFPAAAFVSAYCKHANCTPDTPVRRIEFRYVDPA
jgi:hypothetical protein